MSIKQPDDISDNYFSDAYPNFFIHSTHNKDTERDTGDGQCF